MQSKKETLQTVSKDSNNTRVDIWLSGLNFPNNSCVNLYQKTYFTHDNWIMLAATEVITDSKEPSFPTHIPIQFYFSIRQEILAEIIDITSNTIIAKAEFVLTDVTTAPNRTLSVIAQKSQHYHSVQETILIVKADRLSDCLDEVKLQFGGTFYKKYMFAPKTFISLWRYEAKEEKYVPVVRGEIFKGSMPTWSMMQVKLMDLCEKDFSRPLRLVVHKIPKLQKEKTMGSLDFTLEDVFRGKTNYTEFYSSKIQTKKAIGRIYFQSKETVRIPQFLDFVFNGLDICSVLGLDLSNDAGAKDWVTEQKLSKYEQLLKHLIALLVPYSTSKKIFCYGFGAKMNEAEVVQESKVDCFPLSRNLRKHYYREFSSMQRDYRNAMQMSEPTEAKDLTPVLLAILSYLSKDSAFASKKRYYCKIMLIEQDVEDIQQVIDLMVLLSKRLAVTLMLIGVGEGPYPNLSDFSVFAKKTHELYDTKGELLEANSIIFVSMQDCKGNPVAIVKELLKVIPNRIFLSKMLSLEG